MREMGLDFTVFEASIDETAGRDESPDDFVQRMALEKTDAARQVFADAWIIGGDTVVCHGEKLLGKPGSEEEAVTMLMSLAGGEHAVKTGVCVACANLEISVVRVVTTRVFFNDFSEVVARAYVAAGESMDKAGGYGIQGMGACLVRGIDGSYSNVVGLPLGELLEILTEYKVIEPCLTVKY